VSARFFCPCWLDLKRIELAQELTGSARTLWKLQTALEDAGVEFIPEDDLKGPGVRLKESGRAKARRKSPFSPKLASDSGWALRRGEPIKRTAGLRRAVAISATLAVAFS
jgi:hypothetical protein